MKTPIVITLGGKAYSVLEHLTSVGGDLDNAPINPSQMLSEMISSLPDDK